MLEITGRTTIEVNPKISRSNRGFQPIAELALQPIVRVYQDFDIITDLRARL